MTHARQIDLTQRRRALSRLAGIARALAFAGMAMVAGFCLYLLFDPEALAAHLRREAVIPLTMATDWRLWLAYALSLIPALGFLAAMWQAQRFFGLLGEGRLFDRAAPRILVRLGWIAIGLAAASIVVRTLVVLVLTSANPPGQRQLAISISSTDVASLVVGLLFLAFALVMQEALILEDENRSFV